MLKKSTIAIAIVAMFSAGSVSAAILDGDSQGDHVSLYGEVGVGGHFDTHADYNHDEFWDTKGYVDDSLASMGVEGQRQQFTYRLELDYQRRNWLGGDGELELAIDKMYVGYLLTEQQWVEFGLTDTAFDDYDHFGDLTFNKAVETGEAGDQEQTVKYQAKFENLIFGTSYTYDGEHKSGAQQGDIINGYVGWMSDFVSAVVGLETRGGSNGVSKYGEQKQVGAGIRFNLMPDLTLGLNGFLEEEDLATRKSGDAKTYLDYQTFTNKGVTFSAKYDLGEHWEIISSVNHEEYEGWDLIGPNYDYSKLAPKYGKERRWASLGFNYLPARDIVLSLEGRVGEAPEAAYAFARMYF
jgi:outer membrane pore protein F